MEDEFDSAKFTRVYLKMRDARRKLAKEFKTRDDAIKSQQDTIAACMLDFLNKSNQKTSTNADGLFYKQEEITPTGSDWSAFYEWVKEEDAFEFLEKRIKKTAIAAYMKNHKADDGTPKIPPGVSIYRRWVVRCRRAEEKDEGDE